MSGSAAVNGLDKPGAAREQALLEVQHAGTDNNGLGDNPKHIRFGACLRRSAVDNKIEPY